jgi:hypothetical protein
VTAAACSDVLACVRAYIVGTATDLQRSIAERAVSEALQDAQRVARALAPPAYQEDLAQEAIRITLQAARRDKIADRNDGCLTRYASGVVRKIAPRSMKRRRKEVSSGVLSDPLSVVASLDDSAFMLDRVLDAPSHVLEIETLAAKDAGVRRALAFACELCLVGGISQLLARKWKVSAARVSQMKRQACGILNTLDADALREWLAHELEQRRARVPSSAEDIFPATGKNPATYPLRA